MSTIALKVLRRDNTTAAVSSAEDEVSLVYSHAYREGDQIVLECEKEECYLMIQLEDAIGSYFVWLQKGRIAFEVPFAEQKICYSPKSFSGEKHLLKARFATKEEIKAYKNLALNPYDQHGETTCYPHASANVETRGEAVFAAKNAINGNTENHSHGEWPYESWGINQNPEASMKIDFGRPVTADKMRIYLRADFPHDAWWKQAKFTFSDNSEMEWDLIKTDRAQEITFEPKTITWIRIDHLIKAEDASPFPALTQIEVYGTEIHAAN